MTFSSAQRREANAAGDRGDSSSRRHSVDEAQYRYIRRSGAQVKLINETAVKGRRSLVLLAESTDDEEFNREMFELMRRREVLAGQLERSLNDEFHSLRLEEKSE